MAMTIKELMIPVSEYVTVRAADTLSGYFHALEADKAAKGGAHSHRDALVLDDDGNVAGKVTMLDIFLALEPGYKSLLDSLSDTSVLTPAYLADIYKDFNLWAQPLANLCQRSSKLIVSEFMHTPLEAEYVRESDQVDIALHRYVMGVHSPLLVRGEDGKVVGVLRFGDVFKRIKDLTLACAV